VSRSAAKEEGEVSVHWKKKGEGRKEHSVILLGNEEGEVVGLEGKGKGGSSMRKGKGYSTFPRLQRKGPSSPVGKRKRGRQAVSSARG